MDTKLRKNKKVNAFIYRALSMILLLIMLFTGAFYMPELVKSGSMGAYLLLTGNATGIFDYSKTLSEIFDNAMLGYAGIDGSTHYTLNNTYNVQEQAHKAFHSIVNRDSSDLLYFIYDNKEDIMLDSNLDFPIITTSNNELSIPDNTESYVLWHRDSYSISNIPQFKFPQTYDESRASELTIFLALDKNSYSSVACLSEYYVLAQHYRILLTVFFGALVLFVFMQILILVSRKAWKEAREVYGMMSRRVLLEAKLVLAALTVYGIYHQTYEYYYQLQRQYHGLSSVIVFLPLVIYGFLLFLLWTDIRVNQGSIFSAFVPAILWRYARTWKNSLPWQKQILLRCQIAGYAGLLLLCICLYILGTCYSFTNLRFLIPCIIFLILGVCALSYSFIGQYRLYKEMFQFSDMISQIRMGNLMLPKEAQPKYLFLKKPFDDLTELEKGMESAVAQKSKADRMRVELLTNVSHDLKTPLTSIINYADLLCEEPLSPPANEYAGALRDKAYTLRNMVQDVFELSKAASGNLPIEKDTLDLCKLIKQTLADMEERILASTITFKTVLPEAPAFIEGDGNKLYRVFQNLYINTLQYSLECSRVHTLLICDDRQVTVKLKNISKNELSFDTEEIIDRFMRADSSRTSEGSGLGLSIVQSFTEACGGQFHIEKDADMFTAVLTFPAVLPAAEKPSETECSEK